MKYSNNKIKTLLSTYLQYGVCIKFVLTHYVNSHVSTKARGGRWETEISLCSVYNSSMSSFCWWQALTFESRFILTELEKPIFLCGLNASCTDQVAVWSITQRTFEPLNATQRLLNLTVRYRRHEGTVLLAQREVFFFFFLDITCSKNARSMTFTNTPNQSPILWQTPIQTHILPSSYQVIALTELVTIFMILPIAHECLTLRKNKATCHAGKMGGFEIEMYMTQSFLLKGFLCFCRLSYL